MAEDEAQREAEKQIEQARVSGATTLDLSGMGLESLPESLGRLTKLDELDVSHNQLTSLPEWLGRLTQLQTLELSDNGLTSLPESLGGLTQLQTLELSDNELTSLPESLGELTQLQSLELGSNQLTSLPEWLGRLTQLQRLNLYCNQLRLLPEWLGRLTQLQTLKLYHNQLTSLPESLGRLTNLLTLYLDRNKLTALPAHLGQLTQLQELDLSDNKLTALPAKLRQLSRLEKLFLHGNPELGLPPEILGPTWGEVQQGKTKPAAPQAILDYYFRAHAPQPPGPGGEREGEEPPPTPARSLNEAKVILVGQGGVGKTSLVNRIVWDTFNPKESKTEGISINKDWSVAGRNGERSIQINFWDFGGQEIMHATHQFFLTRRTVYLLVLDARKGENECNLQYWLKVIRSYGGDSPVLVVVNKCEAHYRELNETRLGKDHPNIRGFFNTSCEKNKGIPKLKAAIAEQVHGEDMAHVFDLLPGEYFTVKEELEALAEEKDRIDIHEYYDLCKQRGISKREEQDRLLRFLHDLGSVLNFNDPTDPYELKDTNVLKPEWVTAGVYKVLNDVEVAKRGGELTRGNLRHILSPETHPEDCYDFIIDMMRKFELCFAVEAKQRWLVPELLHVNEPDLNWTFEQSLNFEYHYEVLPPGIICRFITRRYKNLTEAPTYWRSGVVLELDGCRALVRSDTDKGRMFVSVNGPEKRRRGALAVIRDEFRLIHGTVPKLEPKEMVPLPDQREVTVEYEHLLKLEVAREDTVWPGGAKHKQEVSKLLDGVEEPHMRQRRHGMGGQRGSGHNFQGAEIGKVVMGDDRSISDVEAEQLQAATGDHNTQEMNVNLPEPSEKDMVVNLEAIRAIVGALQLESEDAKYAERQLENAKDEVQEDEPDKDAVAKALERTTKRLEKVGKLAGAIDKLKPYATAIGQWLGKTSVWWLSASE